MCLCLGFFQSSVEEEMGARVRMQQYNLGSADSYIGTSLHDLNSVDGPPRDIDGIGGSGGGDSLDNDGDSSSAVCKISQFLGFMSNLPQISSKS